MSEFLDYAKGDTTRNKQDSEQRAFYRLAERLKRAFPNLPILLLLDGQFPVGPVMERCRQTAGFPLGEPDRLRLWAQPKEKPCPAHGRL